MYIIRSTTERDDATGRPLYWSNRDGWVYQDDATVFLDTEQAVYMWLPIGGAWEEL